MQVLFTLVDYNRALIISRLRYALPVWSGFLTVDLSNRIEGLLKRLKRGGYLKEYTSFAKLSIDVSHDLFLKTQESKPLSKSSATCLQAFGNP